MKREQHQLSFSQKRPDPLPVYFSLDIKGSLENIKLFTRVIVHNGLHSCICSYTDDICFLFVEYYLCQYGKRSDLLCILSETCQCTSCSKTNIFIGIMLKKISGCLPMLVQMPIACEYFQSYETQLRIFIGQEMLHFRTCLLKVCFTKGLDSMIDFSV